jgi:type VI secretion system protein VasG
MLQGIVRLQLNRIVKRIAENHGIKFEYTQDVVELIVSRCNEVASGGRMIDAILTNTMLPDLSISLLNRQMSGETVEHIKVGVEGSEFTYAFDGPAAAPAAAEAAEQPPEEAVAEPA